MLVTRRISNVIDWYTTQDFQKVALKPQKTHGSAALTICPNETEPAEKLKTDAQCAPA
jgi:hypothetical protein